MGPPSFYRQRMMADLKTIVSTWLVGARKNDEWDLLKIGFQSVDYISHGQHTPLDLAVLQLHPYHLSLC